MSTSETTISTNTEPAEETTEPTVVVAGGTGGNEALTEATLDSLTKLNELEAKYSNVEQSVAGKADQSQVSELTETMRQGFSDVIGGVKEALSGIMETVKSPASAVTEAVTESPKPDTAPVSKEPWFTRKWGRRSE